MMNDSAKIEGKDRSTVQPIRDAKIAAQIVEILGNLPSENQTRILNAVDVMLDLDR